MLGIQTLVSEFSSKLMCHNPMRSIILRSVPQSYRIVTHQFGTKFWKKVLGCLAYFKKVS
jgi:hypothetical protein